MQDTQYRARPNRGNLGLAPWEPHEGNKKRMFNDAVDVLNEWVGSGELRSMTVRSILYRLIPLGWTKSDKDYQDLIYVLSRGRRSGRIPFDWIADGRSEHFELSRWENASEFLGQCRREAESFRLDRLRGQPLVELWVETAGMLEMLEPLAAELGTNMYCSSGFNSLTAKYGASSRLLRAYERGVVIVFVGDLDPSGESRILNVRDDLLAIAADRLASTNVLGRDACMEQVASRVEFVTAAITREQVYQHNIPTDPAKPVKMKTGKTRALPAGWSVGDPTAQCEALRPNVLLAAIRDTVHDHLDLDVLEQTLADEQDERELLLERFDDGGEA